MPSFDIVSEVDRHELTNAVDQTNREVGTRFDFKGSQAQVVEVEAGLRLEAESEFQITQMLTILQQKASKRQIDVASLQEGDIESRGSRAYMTITVREGIESDIARNIVKLVKESKIKVQTAIQGDSLRVTGKKRDDLQQVMALLRESKIDLPLQFNNFRD
ncbi:MAG: YajQ family cyclic di-GMP-binding protein [Gammaproteobacteria bacterium]|nr:YajQ family cyclic di-GMP-binding protein [Gammaproteobacteria bacterium]